MNLDFKIISIYGCEIKGSLGEIESIQSPLKLFWIRRYNDRDDNYIYEHEFSPDTFVGVDLSIWDFNIPLKPWIEEKILVYKNVSFYLGAPEFIMGYDTTDFDWSSLEIK